MRRVWGLIFRESRFVLSVAITKRHPTSGTEMSEGAGLPSMSDASQPLAHSKHLKISIFKKDLIFLLYVCVCSGCGFLHVSIVPQEAQRQCLIPYSWSSSCCEPRDVGTGTQTRVLCKSNA